LSLSYHISSQEWQELHQKFLSHASVELPLRFPIAIDRGDNPVPSGKCIRETPEGPVRFPHKSH
jgi:hypothetical protein